MPFSGSILIVDDEIDFIEPLVKRLKKRDIDAVGVSSGEKALKVLNDKKFDFIILDIKLPGGMDGISTLRAIRTTHKDPHILLLTGHASVETGIEGMTLGACDYLLKPITLKALLKKLDEAREVTNSVDETTRRENKIEELRKLSCSNNEKGRKL